MGASALLERREAAGDAVMPSYTHLQRAEPVLVAHWMLAYVEMILRDAGRLKDCAARLNYLPAGFGSGCGSNAGAGSHHRRAGAWVHGAHGELDGRDQRSRFHPRVFAGADICRIASEPVC